MLPDAEGLRSGIEFFARRRGRPIKLDPAAVAEVIAHASRLAAGEPRSEPAALFFACAQRSRAFGAVAHDAVPFIAVAHAHHLGLSLVVKEVELDVLRARIVYGAIDFEELRAWFASRLRPPLAL